MRQTVCLKESFSSSGPAPSIVIPSRAEAALDNCCDHPACVRGWSGDHLNFCKWWLCESYQSDLPEESIYGILFLPLGCWSEWESVLVKRWMCWQKPLSWPWADVETSALHLAGDVRPRFGVFWSFSKTCLISPGSESEAGLCLESQESKERQKDIHWHFLQTSSKNPWSECLSCKTCLCFLVSSCPWSEQLWLFLLWQFLL